jgi:outer membrane receptor for monomeric catechols
MSSSEFSVLLSSTMLGVVTVGVGVNAVGSPSNMSSSGITAHVKRYIHALWHGDSCIEFRVGDVVEEQLGWEADQDRMVYTREVI